jgi:nanoRNase/pAp phosphatase (c-di-AMP/oligoRNAs hydrolase)
MNNQNQSPKQQIAQTLRDAETVLVTVNTNPTVDELSAALGFTLLLNKLDKHATAVFSGKIPSAIEFLSPEKTFEDTVDSLRDFIIALDKEKADHLRYKIDGDMVKIFITPYKTTISDKDLDFSQGDYNVEAVVAIGVQNNDDFDRALADHGRIMHDATVVSLSIDSLDSKLGSINWYEKNASSYSELLVELSEALRTDKRLLDEQISTAFLTGIVAATDRFSNEKTTSNAMTIAAQLMAAGANQQLIAVKLEESEEISDRDEAAPRNEEDETNDPNSSENQSQKSTKDNSKNDSKENNKNKTKQKVYDKQQSDGTMLISHEPEGDVDEVARQVSENNQKAATQLANEQVAQFSTTDDTKGDSSSVEKNTSNADNFDSNQQVSRPSEPSLPNVAVQPEEKLAADLQAAGINPGASQASSDLNSDLAQVLLDQKKNEEINQEPTFSGTLNATTEQAAIDKLASEKQDKNKTILTHGGQQYVENNSNIPAVNSFNQADVPGVTSEPPAVDVFGGATSTAHSATIKPAEYAVPGSQPVVDTPLSNEDDAVHGSSGQTLADIDANVRQKSHDDIRDQINAAIESSPQQNTSSFEQAISQDTQAQPYVSPQPQSFEVSQLGESSTMNGPQSSMMPQLPPLPDFSTLPQLPSTDTNSISDESQLDSILPPLPPLPPISNTDNFSGNQQSNSQPQTSDPSQFRIPGQ